MSKIPEADFIRLFEELGPERLAKQLDMDRRNVYARRVRIERRIGRQLTSQVGHPTATRHNVRHPQRVLLSVESGVVLIGSDGHYWPGEASTAHRAFVAFIKELKPKIVVMNGDAFDGASISRHPPIGWEDKPTVQQELEAVQERLSEIELVTPRSVELLWSLGNHDGRLETRIATVAPELARMKGVHLKDHFGPRWQPCWSAWINDVVVKHRYRGGMHASHNNALWAGKTMVTGHTHQLRVSPVPDYNGVRWGVETGCLADPYGQQFVDYTEDNPRLWQSGFAVLTFHKGILLQPELVRVHDENHVDFRGSLIRV